MTNYETVPTPELEEIKTRIRSNIKTLSELAPNWSFINTKLGERLYQVQTELDKRNHIR